MLNNINVTNDYYNDLIPHLHRRKTDDETFLSSRTTIGQLHHFARNINNIGNNGSIDWLIDWLIDCSTARQHRNVNLCQMRGKKTGLIAIKTITLK